MLELNVSLIKNIYAHHQQATHHSEVRLKVDR